MKFILITLTLFISNIQIGQAQESNKISFVTSPSVDTSSIENKEILILLDQFLNSKNQHYLENDYWIKSDFARFKYPFYELIGMEYDANYNIINKIDLMAIYDINESEKLVKLGYLAPDSVNKAFTILLIYNIIATKDNDNWKFKRAVDYVTRDWQKVQKESLLYYLPPGKKPNETEIKKQLEDITKICTFFNTTPIDIHYYSCNSPIQVFEVKGFDYHPSMLVSKTGGMTADGNIVYSGNNSEFYTHEIIHIYIKNLFPQTPQILNEGIATYIGGSGKNDYLWHREVFANYMDTAQIDLSAHLQPYERLYINKETSIPYMIGALICERTLRIYGKEALFNLFNSKQKRWPTLNQVGLTKENLTIEIKKELKKTRKKTPLSN